MSQVCSASYSNDPMIPLKNIAVKNCEEIKKSEQCQKIYEKIQYNGVDVSSRALRCETDFDASTYEKLSVNYIGCLRGGIIYGFVEPIKSLAVWLGESSAKAVLSLEADANRQKNCDQNPEHKTGLYKRYNDSVPTILNLEIPAEDILARKSCAQIEADLYHASKLKERNISRRYDYKLIQNNPSMTELEFEYLDWKKRKTEFASKNSQNLSEMADKLLRSYGIHTNCYNREARAALQCEIYVMSVSGGLLAREGILKILAGFKNLEKTAEVVKLSSEVTAVNGTLEVVSSSRVAEITFPLAPKAAQKNSTSIVNGGQTSTTQTQHATVMPTQKIEGHAASSKKEPSIPPTSELELEKYLTAKVGNGSEVSFKKFTAVTRSDDNYFEYKIRVGDKDIGRLSWQTSKDGEVLTIKEFNIFDTDFRRKGISNDFLQFILQQNPKIKEIYTRLMHENEQAFKVARAAGASCEEAIMATPAYKIRKKAGFSKIVHVNCDPNELLLGVGR